jgi:CrcB protein
MGSGIGYVLVFLGGGVGAALRHGVNILSVRWFGFGFPWGTFTVNVVGSTAMGLLAAWFALRGGGPQHWRLFLTTGVLGGFTTFSTFSLDAATLWERGAFGTAFLYVAGSLVFGLAGLFAGLWLIRMSS